MNSHGPSATEVLPKIRVIVRKRPLNSKERQKNNQDVVEMKSENSLIVKELK